MYRFALDGDWQLAYFPAGSAPVNEPADLSTAGVPRIAARVPGNVELDLTRAGIIPEPFYAANIRLLRPYERYEWWYAREFELPDGVSDGKPSDIGGQWDLVCEGLDTLATVWVNGIEVGRAENMLVAHRFDVTSALRMGHNEIAVRLGSAVNHARQYEYDAASSGAEGREEALYIRKAPHVWGWDIMPRAVSAGIWRPIYLEARPAVAIEPPYFWTIETHPGGATLGARWQFHTDDTALDGFSLYFRGVCGEHTFEFEWPVEFLAGGCRIPVEGARLWMPKGYGEPNLYEVTTELRKQGRVLASRVDRIGIRTVVIDRTETAGQVWSPEAAAGGVNRLDQPADPASHFIIRVNGEPVMAKGTNWVPLDAFHSRDIERVDRALELLDDIGCNMVRCWGGNAYENNRFFDLCDEKGILIWQDFAYACSRYPQTDAFLAQVRAEAEAVVKRLRNHPCLAIWCGDNEIDGFYVNEGLSPEHNRLTREALPQVLHRFDPHRAFVPSSPYVPPVLTQNPTADVWTHTPEQHLWGPRGYFKSPFYTQHSAHFIGEIGYHGCPNVSSIRRFISPGALWPWYGPEGANGWNDEWQAHAVYHWNHRAIDRDRIRLMANQVQELFGVIPDDLETFALASQIVEAEAVKFFIESTRLRKWRTSGILWWNLIDGWPQFSDSVVDYYFGIKLAYHYIRRVQQPVCVIIGEPGPGKHFPVVVSNDSLSAARVRYCVTEAGANEPVAAGEIEIPANQNWQVDRIRGYASDHKVYLIEWEVDGQRFGNHYLTGAPPFSLEQYRGWLSAIATLPRPFEAATVAE
jgi:beta-mannosidase